MKIKSMRCVFIFLFLIFVNLHADAAYNATTSKVVAGDIWRCYAEDWTRERYFASDDSLDASLSKAGRVCDIHSNRPLSCKTARGQCARTTGNDNWVCHAHDRFDRRWRGTGRSEHASKNDALFRCQKYSASARTCIVRDSDCYYYR